MPHLHGGPLCCQQHAEQEGQLTGEAELDVGLGGMGKDGGPEGGGEVQRLWHGQGQGVPGVAVRLVRLTQARRPPRSTPTGVVLLGTPKAEVRHIVQSFGEHSSAGLAGFDTLGSQPRRGSRPSETSLQGVDKV